MQKALYIWSVLMHLCKYVQSALMHLCKREDSGGLRPPSFSLLRRAGRALRALMGTFDPILSNSLCKFVQIGMQFCAGRDAILCRSGRNFVRIGTQICADWDAILCGSGRKFVQIGTQFCAGSTNRNAAAGHPPPADQSQAFKSYKMRLGWVWQTHTQTHTHTHQAAFILR